MMHKKKSFGIICKAVTTTAGQIQCVGDVTQKGLKQLYRDKNSNHTVARL